MTPRISPSPNGSNGRGSNGRFTPGNPGGPGNPYARTVADLRKAFMEAVSKEDIREIARGLVERAKGGDLHAAREEMVGSLLGFEVG